MEITIQLDSEHAAQLTYIQQHTQLDPVAVLTREIERAYQQLQSNNNPVNPLSHSPFIGCFQGSIDLATNSKSIINEILTEKFPSAEIPSA
jgi:hypothetical protein